MSIRLDTDFLTISDQYRDRPSGTQITFAEKKLWEMINLPKQLLQKETVI